jgi:hypothetical protein
VDGNFKDPGPAKVRKLLVESGATLVLCGHAHVHEHRRIRDRLPVVISGGGYKEDDDDWLGYHLIDLYPNGKMKIDEEHRL